MAALMTARYFKIAGIVLLLVPIAILLLFAIGESVGGDLSGLGHLIQAAPLVVLALVAWRWPRIGGWILTVVGALLALGYLVLRTSGGDVAVGVVLFSDLLLFGPAIVAGLLFLEANRRTPTQTGGA